MLEELMNETGIGEDIFGRRRTVPKSEIKKSYKHALNMFVNFHIQSPCAYYLMLAEGQVRDEFIDVDMWLSDIWPINEVHDEVCFLARDWCADDCIPIIAEKLRYAVPLDVPMDCDYIVSDRWEKA